MNLAHKPAMALNGPQFITPRPSLRYWGGQRFMTQAIWVRKQFMAIFMVPWTPCNSGLRGSSNPHGPRTIGHTKDQKRPKMPLITNPSRMARTQNTQEGP
ncbi:hypothetical protein O181_068493 [Austropuccinia psidii MF-1]|uniref:Uncharacterized protein n=1 Tax=Austropuccinia psidii MF-1 TaxID=1389203 RepID=A0A9Q3F0H9_9BASI|nr:hypothetical protein [Austropuccinia psidii MF-1]